MIKVYNRYIGHYDNNEVKDVIAENIIEASELLSSLSNNKLDIIKLMQSGIILSSNIVNNTVDFSTNILLDTDEEYYINNDLSVYPKEGNIAIGSYQIFTAVSNNEDIIFDHWSIIDTNGSEEYTDNPVHIKTTNDFKLIAYFKTKDDDAEEQGNENITNDNSNSDNYNNQIIEEEEV